MRAVYVPGGDGLMPSHHGPILRKGRASKFDDGDNNNNNNSLSHLLILPRRHERAHKRQSRSSASLRDSSFAQLLITGRGRRVRDGGGGKRARDGGGKGGEDAGWAGWAGVR